MTRALADNMSAGPDQAADNPNEQDEETLFLPQKDSGCCFRHFCGPYTNEACGYPPKTVRGIIAVLLLIGVLCCTGFALVWLLTHDETTLSIAMIDGLTTLLGGVVGFYFGHRSATKKEEVGRVVEPVQLGRAL